ncbi:hypothetical protein FE839_10620 [Klebsiella indica]|uniref:Uncharacterized protein n=1 Tax=Klebsiella indica TaxID=2582917 RepID=A0A5R9LIQ3_9ENTR|nr:hypothetical protein FE839_10620 [Klebsiella indica]
MSFSSDTLAISPSCFVLTDVVRNESSSQQHIKKNYRGNMNVCANNLKKYHSAGNDRTKHHKEKERQTVTHDLRINVT